MANVEGSQDVPSSELQSSAAEKLSAPSVPMLIGAPVDNSPELMDVSICVLSLDNIIRESGALRHTLQPHEKEQVAEPSDWSTEPCKVAWRRESHVHVKAVDSFVETALVSAPLDENPLIPRLIHIVWDVRIHASIELAAAPGKWACSFYVLLKFFVSLQNDQYVEKKAQLLSSTVALGSSVLSGWKAATPFAAQSKRPESSDQLVSRDS
ncbi:hypothetical protein PsorP6_016255 [Peronosclerospora sorghi]|uniref:Uncharacterized protein n=1 Tax=Peronosclerospora sorghi TaxID=230839 RepID=A0ACC0VKZ3_9STRA|nr:hypothetical protein PsorP6_016255 [Peronosclerospora sorghi]